MQKQGTQTTGQVARNTLAVFVAAALAFGGAFSCALAPARAFAETDDIYAEADAAQRKVEQYAVEYDQATARVQELEQQISDNEGRISELEQSIPEQQEKAASACRAMYKMQKEAPGLIELIISSNSFSEFLSNVEYLTHIQDSNCAEIDRLQSMRDELQQTRDSLNDTKMEAVNQQEQAQTSLAEAQAAREEAQRKAQQKAAEEAAAAAAAKAAAEAAAAQAAQAQASAATAATESADSANNTAGQQATSSDSSTAANTNTSTATEEVSTPTADGADWSSDKSSFVSSWGARINNYLAGSNLAGTGTIFAEAAWDYGVDPRWSPAIAYAESGLGAACFRPHNAWGWGSSSWSSWDEAIRAHVAGLGRGYGYTISVSAAQKYCPPNWSHWYNVVSAQMERI